MARFKWLMFDIDNTLLDFSAASKDALWKTYNDVGVECNSQLYETYLSVNHANWTAFEQGALTAERLRVKRFEELFEATNIRPIVPEQFSVMYLENLVRCSRFYNGVPGLLEDLGRKYAISAITNGLREVQRPRIERLGLTKHFDSIIVSDEIGVGKPATAFFEHAVSSLPLSFNRDEILVIGDNIIADVGGANLFGCKSCWISHGRSNNSDIEPEYIISTISELPLLLKFLN